MNPPVRPLLRLYFFNTTNPAAFLRGAKPVLNEVHTSIYIISTQYLLTIYYLGGPLRVRGEVGEGGGAVERGGGHRQVQAEEDLHLQTGSLGPAHRGRQGHAAQRAVICKYRKRYFFWLEI